jgi:hypothetical protein
MESPYCYKNTIAKAASLATGYRLDALYRICETQKSISTKKVERYLDKLHEDMKLDAIYLRELANRMDK